MNIKPIREKWGGTMTPRERFNRQMSFRPVDRSFNMEFGYWEENYCLWDIFRDNGIKSEGAANVFFGFDPIDCIGPRFGGWMHPAFEHRIIERRDDINLLMNGDGLIAEVPADGHDTIPHYIKASIVTPDDWKRCKEERFRRDDPARKLDIAAIKLRHPDERDYPLGVNCGSMIGKIRDMLTFEGLAYATYDYPEMVEDMVETCCLLIEDGLDQLLPEIKFDYAAGWEDICFKNGPIVSVDFFRDVVTPRYKRIRQKLDKHGITLWYTDCDGDVRPILKHMMDGGINCLFPFEVMGCAHPGELLDAYPGLRIMGGVDKIQLGSGRDAIRKYLDSILPYVERGGYIPFCDHRCPPNVPPEDYLFYLDLKRQMFGGGF